MQIKTLQVSNLKEAIYSMRNPMNSWDKSDTLNPAFASDEFVCECGNKASGSIYIQSLKRAEDGKYYDEKGNLFTDQIYRAYSVMSSEDIIGPSDLKLAQSLIKAGPEHYKFLRMIHVIANFDMPRYFWSEADTYHFGTKNSCSTMHKLLNNSEPITLNQFVYCEEDSDILQYIITRLEFLRQIYKQIQADDSITDKQDQLNRLLLRAKRILPEGFLQMRTWDTNYSELRNIYFQRRHHRLKEEWQDTFCEWVKTLPYAEELITFEG